MSRCDRKRHETILVNQRSQSKARLVGTFREKAIALVQPRACAGVRCKYTSLGSAKKGRMYRMLVTDRHRCYALAVQGILQTSVCMVHGLPRCTWVTWNSVSI
jgi:hypothetical protein